MNQVTKVLVANRGEIAVRVIRACREAGLETVAVYSDVDAAAPHVELATEAYSLGGSTAKESYLDPEKLLAAARETGADAIHPGYGFLSENDAFSEAVEAAGLVFIGPKGETIRLMGSKTQARAEMEGAGVPVVPGYQGDCENIPQVRAEASRIGFPVLVKAVYGGGGKGMRVVRSENDLEEALKSAASEAQSAFGNSQVFLERFVVGPRHVEVQILGDGHGNAVHVGERECSVQRRHQKVIEECPAVQIAPEVRSAICQAGVRAAEAVSYRGAGTVEFLVTPDEEFYFLEMNTRLQVEHPVTECVYGRDLVRAQLAIAASETLPFKQSDLTPRGHAIEARIYAECPEKGFMPSVGELLRFDVPQAPWIRLDSGVRAGMEISVYYDPMIAKLIVWAETRQAAIARMERVLEETVIHGVETNVGLLLRILRSEPFQSGEVHTRWLDEEGSVLWDGVSPSLPMALAAWAVVGGVHSSSSAPSTQVNAGTKSPWTDLGAWALGGSNL